VYITRDNRAVLIDFGSARGFVQGQSRRHTQLVTPGYAAPEQYATEAKFGTYTDVYGLSATLYHAVTGKPPPTASDRVISSDTELRLPSTVTEPLRTALARGLALRVDARPQNIQSLSIAFVGSKNDFQLSTTPKPTESSLTNQPSKEKVIFRGHGVLVTSHQVEITHYGKNKTVKKYYLKDIESSFSTNNGQLVPISSLSINRSILIFSMLVPYFIALFSFPINSPDFVSFIFFSFILILVIASSFILWYRHFHRSTYYVILKTKIGASQSFFHNQEHLVIYRGKDFKEAEDLAAKVSTYF
jgi:serine/threonine protein kinase